MSLTRALPRMTSPDCGGSVPAMSLSSVDAPHAGGPTMAVCVLRGKGERDVAQREPARVAEREVAQRDVEHAGL